MDSIISPSATQRDDDYAQKVAEKNKRRHEARKKKRLEQKQVKADDSENANKKPIQPVEQMGLKKVPHPQYRPVVQSNPTSSLPKTIPQSQSPNPNKRFDNSDETAPAKSQRKHRQQSAHTKKLGESPVHSNLKGEVEDQEDDVPQSKVAPKKRSNEPSKNNNNNSKSQTSNVTDSKSSDRPSFITDSAFSSLKLTSSTQKALDSVFKYELMSRVQAECIPLALKGEDLLAKAKTGTGKTLAFLIPIIERISQNKLRSDEPVIHSLIISPTRELAQQISDECNKLATFHPGMKCVAVVGGTNIKADSRALQSGCTVLVATPGRLLDLLENHQNISKMIAKMSFLVFDEADRLLDEGFRPHLVKIMEFVPKVRQSMLFSATVSEQIQSISHFALKKHHTFVDCVDVDDSNSNAQVNQYYSVVSLENHVNVLFELLSLLIEENPKDYKIMVFFTTARVTGFMSQLFNLAGIKTLQLHSRMSQSQRQKISDEFRVRTQRVLFSSDVSARGLDYENVTHVIQMGVASGREQYIHRIGRTGRAGQAGEAILLLQPFETRFLKQLEDLPLAEFPAKEKSAHLAELVAQRPTHFQLFDVDSTSFSTNHSLDDSEMSPKLRAALEAVEGDEGLKNAAQQAYSSWLGFYNGHLKLAQWNKQSLLKYANYYASLLGLKMVPEISSKMVGMVGLKGLRGLRVESRETSMMKKKNFGGQRNNNNNKNNNNNGKPQGNKNDRRN